MKKLINWSNEYFIRIHRNLGPITVNEQEQIRSARIGIFGLGGLGGSLAIQLARVGCQYFVICDNDKFDKTNLNRQICTLEDIGKYKIDRIENFILNIDPNTKIQKIYEVTEENITEIIQNVDFAVLTLDDLIASIIIARKCRKMNVPLLESWGIPCLWAWWFTSNSIDYEACYDLPTHNLSIEEIKEKNLASLKFILPKLFRIPGVKESYDREPGIYQSLLKGKHASPSFTPFVHFTSSYLLVEIIFAGILKTKSMIKAPRIVGFDYLRMKMIDFTF
jgi:hypothetical protein